MKISKPQDYIQNSENTQNSNILQSSRNMPSTRTLVMNKVKGLNVKSSKKLKTKRYSDFLKKRVVKTSSEERIPPKSVHQNYMQPTSFLSDIDRPIYGSRIDEAEKETPKMGNLESYFSSAVELKHNNRSKITKKSTVERNKTDDFSFGFSAKSNSPITNKLLKYKMTSDLKK